MITKQQVNLAQGKWADAVIMVGESYIAKNDYIFLAKNKILPLYALEKGFLFKPTMAGKIYFRNNKQGLLSYFVANNSEIYKEDKGFALTGWQKIYFENYDYNLSNKYAFVMGNYFFTKNKKVVKVNFSFAYELNMKGVLDIILHHSSIPYSC